LPIIVPRAQAATMSPDGVTRFCSGMPDLVDERFDGIA
jgi:hypothetical protein